jgi:hypothetical protein
MRFNQIKIEFIWIKIPVINIFTSYISYSIQFKFKVFKLIIIIITIIRLVKKYLSESYDYKIWIKIRTCDFVIYIP